MSISRTPSDWRTGTVADICRMQNGHGFGPEDWETAGLPIIRIQNLNGGSKFDYFSGKPESRWLVEPGQLLFAWAGTRGVSFGPTVWHGPLGVLNQHIFKLEAKEGIDRNWLFWALRHITNRIEGQAHGFKATLVHVKKSDIDRQPVSIPPIQEQQRIATALDTWEEAIRAAERLLTNSRKQKRALIQRVLTGQKRLTSFRGVARTQPTPHGPIPSDWDYPRIEAFAQEVSTKLGSRSAYPVLSCTKHRGLVDSLSFFNKQIFSVDTSTYKVVPRNCFVYATNHIEEGSIGYQHLHDFGLVSPMYTVFKTKDKVSDGYLYRLLKTERYRQIFAAATNASINRRGSLRWNEFKKLHVPLPSLTEQHAISTLLDTADCEIEFFGKQLALLRVEKSALMEKLLTGKHRVRQSRSAFETTE